MRGNLWEWAAVVALTVVAAGLRLLDLEGVPPGFYHDEAINGVAALEILQGLRPMLYGFDVREPLYLYGTAASVALLGNNALAVRLPAALSGVLAIPVVYLLARRLFGRWVALVAAAGLAFSFWHLSLSRFGVRGITVPLVESLCFYFLWRGIQGRASPLGARILSFALGGLFLGLCAYTYIAARAVPLVIAGFMLWQLVFQRQALRNLLLPYVIFLAMAAIVFAPMASYLIEHPTTITERTGKISVMAEPNPAQAILGNSASTLGMFFLQGDPNRRHNLPEQPVLDPLEGAFFAVGLGLSLWRWRRPQNAFCVLWWSAMLLPGVLSMDSPHFIRTLGASPPTFMLMGIGVVAVGHALRRRPGVWVRAAATLYPAAIVLWLLAVGIATAWGYFAVWAQNPATAHAYEADLARSTRYLAEIPPMPTLVFMPDGHPGFGLPVFPFLGAREVIGVPWYDHDRTVLLPTGLTDPSLAGNETTIIVAYGLEGTIADSLPVMTPQTIVATEELSGERLFAVHRVPVVPSELFAGPEHPLSLTLNDELALEGYTLAPSPSGLSPAASARPYEAKVGAGDTISLDLYWRVVSRASHPDLRVFVHLLNSQGRAWAQEDAEGYPSYMWQGGERGVSRFELPVPADAPPGRYELHLGGYSFADMLRLPLRRGAVLLDANTVVLAPVKVWSPPVAGPAVDFEAHWSDGIRLGGYSLQITAGALEVTLFWQAQALPSHDYTVFVHLLDAAGRLVAQHDSPPASGAFPTSFWEPDDVVADAHAVSLPPDLAGVHTLRVGLYRPGEAQRLPTTAGGDSITLAEIELP